MLALLLCIYMEILLLYLKTFGAGLKAKFEMELKHHSTMRITSRKKLSRELEYHTAIVWGYNRTTIVFLNEIFISYTESLQIHRFYALNPCKIFVSYLGL